MYGLGHSITCCALAMYTYPSIDVDFWAAARYCVAMSNTTFGSIFSGAGGFDMGLELAGWECMWQVEWDKDCQDVLQRHWPDIPKYLDVQTVDGKLLTPVDAVAFGSPCQDLSTAGKRAGLEGGRSSMFYEATRIIKEMKDATGNEFPKWVIWENVVGALSSRGGDDFEAVLREMAELGANHIEWSILNAQYFGVPQNRRRVFVVARLCPAGREHHSTEVLSVAEGGIRNIEAFQQWNKPDSANSH